MYIPHRHSGQHSVSDCEWIKSLLFVDDHFCGCILHIYIHVSWCQRRRVHCAYKYKEKKLQTCLQNFRALIAHIHKVFFFFSPSECFFKNLSPPQTNKCKPLCMIKWVCIHTHTHTKTKTTLLWIHIRMLHNVTLQSTHLHWKWWERQWVKCCSMFVRVISRISWCTWFRIYSVDCTVFVSRISWPH